MLYSAVAQCRKGQTESAKRSLALALIVAAELPEQSRLYFQAAFCYAALLIESRHAPASVTPEMRSEAGALLDQCHESEASEMFASVLFEVLTELGEYKRALRFGNHALSLAIDHKKSISVADWLWKLGGCYSHLGLRDHAMIAYRGSARIFRNEPADPRLPVVLLALGNSVRKTAPSEAESLYKEAASLWESKGQLQSATPAWTNLAILCSDQQRFEEALNYYERVRQVRESSPGTPVVQIGRLYNNLASCYRKMGRFEDAHRSIERALEILEVLGAKTMDETSALGFAVGTKGMILRDEGKHLESLDWFRRACAEFEKQPNPNVENVIEELEHAAAALRHLERIGEVQAVETKIQSLRRAAAEVKAVGYDSNAPTDLTEDTLLIEVPFGNRRSAIEPELVPLGISIDEILKEKSLGAWSGLVRIPECATLICYGCDAHAMYLAIEPLMRSDSRFEGARFSIRHGNQQHEVMFSPSRVN